MCHRIQPQTPQIDPRRPLTEEAYEDALALSEALQWHAEHRHQALLTRAELDEDDAA